MESFHLVGVVCEKMMMNNNNKILAIGTICGSLLVLAILTTTAYGQVSSGGGGSSTPTDIEIINSDVIKQQISSFFFNAKLTNYTLYENGTAVYTFEYAGPTNPSTTGRMTTIELHTTHSYTPERGYVFENSTIFTPDGERLVIETVE